MGPYGPSVEERNEAHLKRLKEKYGDYPEERLLQLAREAMAKTIEKLDKKRKRRKTA